ncbi:MAG: hypothetical protein MJ092_04955 [Lachnospiraceae bacterium]|nr:hypothetical protein [Lachnospiraceae bacterium]
MKKIIVLLMSFMLMLTLLPTSVFADVVFREDEPFGSEIEGAALLNADNFEARIGETYYKTLEDAFEAAQNKDTIVLMRDVNKTAGDPIDVTCKVTLDFNDHQISCSVPMFNVNVGIGEELGDLYLSNADIYCTAPSFVDHTEYGVQIINTNGKIYTTGSFINEADNEAFISLSSGTIECGNNFINSFKGLSSFMMYGGEITAGNCIIEYAEEVKSLEISDGTLTAEKDVFNISSIDAKKIMVIRNGSFTAQNGNVISLGGGSLEIDGGTYVSASENAIYIPENSDVKVLILSEGGANPAEIKSPVVVDSDQAFLGIKGAKLSEDASIYMNGGELSVQSGDFDTKKECFVVGSGAKASIIEGEFTSKGNLFKVEEGGLLKILTGSFSAEDSVIETAGSVEIRGGSFDGKRDILQLGGSATVYNGTFHAAENAVDVLGGNFTIENGEYTSKEKSAVHVGEPSGTVTIKFGEFTGSAGTPAVCGDLSKLVVDESSIVIKDGKTDWKESSHIAIQKAEAKIGTEVYTTLEEAFEKAVDGDEIILLRDVSRVHKEPITVSGKNVIFKTGDYVLASDQTIFNIEQGAGLTLDSSNIQAIGLNASVVGFCNGNLTITESRTEFEEEQYPIAAQRNLVDDLGSTGKLLIRGQDNDKKSPIVDVKGSIVSSTAENSYAKIENVNIKTSGQDAQLFSSISGTIEMSNSTIISAGDGMTLTGKSSKAVIDNCIISAESGGVLQISEGATVEITGRKSQINNYGGTGISVDKGTLNMSGGELFGAQLAISVNNGAKVLLDSVDVTSVYTCVEVAGGNLDIIGGSYESGKDYVPSDNAPKPYCMLIKNGIVNVQNSEEEPVRIHAISDRAMYILNGQVVLNGGCISSEMDSAVEIFEGYLEVNSPTVIAQTNTDSCLFMTHGMVVINGGEFTAKSTVVWNEKPEDMGSGADLFINGGTFASTNESCTLVLNGQANNYINGGEFKTNNNNALRLGSDATVTIKRGIFSCDDGKKPAINDKNGKLIYESSLPDPYTDESRVEFISGSVTNVAKIGDTEYPTLEAAIEAAKEGDTIVLLQDITYTRDPNEPAITIDKKISIDFNEKVLVVKSKDVFDITENGALTLVNAGIVAKEGFVNDLKGAFTIESTSKVNVNTKTAFVNTVRNGAKLTLNDGNFETNSFVGHSESESEIRVNGGSIQSDMAFADIRGKLYLSPANGKTIDILTNFVAIDIVEGGYAEVKSSNIMSANSDCIHIVKGELYSDSNELVGAKDALNVQDGKISSNNDHIKANNACIQIDDNPESVGNVSEVYVNNGSFETESGNIFSQWGGELIVNEGEYSSKDSGVLLIGIQHGSMRILSGTFTTPNEVLAIFGNDAEVTIEDGASFSSQEQLVEVKAGTLNINGGTFENKSAKDLLHIDSGTLNIKNMKGVTKGIGINVVDGKLNIENADISSLMECIQISNNSTATIENGRYDAFANPAVIMRMGSKMTVSGGTFLNGAEGIAIKDNGNFTVAEGYYADPADWKESAASKVVIKPVVPPTPEKEYKVTATAGQGGTVTPSVQQVKEGESATVTMKPENGMVIEKVLIKMGENTYDYTEHVVNGNLSIDNVKSDIDIRVSFAKKGVHPETGDHNNTLLWICLMLAAIAGIGTTMAGWIRRNKR